MRQRTRLGLLLAAVAAAVAVPIAGAQSGDAASPAGPAAGGAQGSTAIEAGLPAGVLEEVDVGEILDDYTEFAEGLAAHLEDLGIDHEVATVPVVTWDFEDPAANDAIIEYLAENGIPLPGIEEGFVLDLSFLEGWEFPEPGEAWEAPFSLPEEMVEELNAAADDLAAFLDERGVDYEVEEGPMGLRWVIPDLGDPAAREALEEYAAEHGHGIFGGIVPGPFHHGLVPGGHGPCLEFEWPPAEGWEFPEPGEAWEAPFSLPEEMVEELNAAADDLAAFLDERGVDYEVEEGPMGLRWVIPDLGDPAAREALEEYAAEHGHGIFGGRMFSFDGPHHSFEWHGPGGRLGPFLEDLFGSTPGEEA